MKYETPTIWLIKNLLDPLIVVLSLVVITLIIGDEITIQYATLCLLALLVISRIFNELDLFETLQQVGMRRFGRDMLMGWLISISILLFIGFAFKLTEAYSRRVLLIWFVSVPFLLLASHWLMRRLLLGVLSGANQRSVIIVGGNELGFRLATKIQKTPYLFMSIKGFFDDRAPARLAIGNQFALQGGLNEVSDYVKQFTINNIYIALPMTLQPRILRLLDALRDTTASIYFVPDLFMFDLAHARFGEVSGMPVIAVSETPFTGANAVVKRLTDVLLSSIFVVILLPVLILIGIGIKLTSPGPILFMQRRYGLDGRKIIVWKFRSMRVQEDGAAVQQATRNDQRVTRFGSFLRRTSLDELPQFFNVLQGTMSLVGPRPHAVAHNEMYRSLIKGYMMRHKVKPGITGLAQINGFRGETETLGKMEQRIKYDIEYLRNWSLLLDLWIILRTAFVVLKDEQAY